MILRVHVWVYMLLWGVSEIVPLISLWRLTVISRLLLVSSNLILTYKIKRNILLRQLTYFSFFSPYLFTWTVQCNRSVCFLTEKIFVCVVKNLILSSKPLYIFDHMLQFNAYSVFCCVTTCKQLSVEQRSSKFIRPSSTLSKNL